MHNVSSRSLRSFLPLFFGLLLFQGCATTLRDFPNEPMFSADDEKIGVLFGHFDVEYNGRTENSKCAVCFTGEESSCYKLPKSGNLLMRAFAGESRVSRVSCLDTVEYHVFPKNLAFRVLAGRRNYIGDVTVRWTNPRTGFQFDKLFDLMGAIVNDKKPDGEAVVVIADRMGDTLAQLDPFFKGKPELPINACVVSQSE